jgi:outer membrane immunogenic protein
MQRWIASLIGLIALSVASAPHAFATTKKLHAAVAPSQTAPSPTWTGAYIGGDVGGAWASNTGTWSKPPLTDLYPVSGPNGGSGPLGGVHIGYNWQFAPTWVAGVEGDWSLTHAGSTNSQGWVPTLPAFIFPGSFSLTSSTLQWMSSLRGRVGYLVTPNIMAYATGGVAWGRFNDGGFSTNTGADTDTLSFSDTRIGYVAGAGLEWAMTSHWLVRTEYLFYHFKPSPTVTDLIAAFPLEPSSYTWSSTSVSVARAGLSYKF